MIFQPAGELFRSSPVTRITSRATNRGTSFPPLKIPVPPLAKEGTFLPVPLPARARKQGLGVRLPVINHDAKPKPTEAARPLLLKRLRYRRLPQRLSTGSCPIAHPL